MTVNQRDLLDLLFKSGVSEKDNQITFDTSFDEAGLDSLDISNFLLCVEEKYNIEIPDDDIESLYSITILADYVSEKCSD